MIALHVYECKEKTKAFSRKKLMDNLSHYLGKSKKEINVQYNENGKPMINELFFSVSHCRDKVAQIYSTEEEIGIDIEFKNPNRPFLKLAERYFHANESRYLIQLPHEDAVDLFYNLWTAKEAVCKAHGGRLWYHLGDNYLTNDHEMLPAIKGMKLHFLNKLPDFNICIASSGKVKNIHHV